MKFRCLALSAALLAAPLHAQTTQTEIQADLLQSQIQAAMQANDHAAAADLFDKYDALGVDMPPPLQKHRAVVYFRLQRYLDAERELQAYLERVERGSEDYRQAISMLTEVTPLAEAARAEAAKARAEAVEKRKAELAAISAGEFNKCEGGHYTGDSLFEAIEEKDCLSAKLLIEKGADVHARNSDGYTPLHWAASGGNAETAMLLLAHGADVNAKATIKMHVLSSSGNYTENSDGHTPLHWAARGGNTATAMLLLAHGADVNAKIYGESSTYRDYTPLHWAAARGNPETAKVLLEYGADVNAKNQYGRTPLHAAAGSGTIEAAKVLLGHGADVNAKAKRDETPLHAVTASSCSSDYSERNAEMAALLIQHGADVNAIEKSAFDYLSDNTPLSLARLCDNAKTANLLLRHGAR